MANEQKGNNTKKIKQSNIVKVILAIMLGLFIIISIWIIGNDDSSENNTYFDSKNNAYFDIVGKYRSKTNRFYLDITSDGKAELSGLPQVQKYNWEKVKDGSYTDDYTFKDPITGYEGSAIFYKDSHKIYFEGVYFYEEGHVIIE